MGYTWNELAGADLRLILVVTLRGVRYRFADRAMTITEEAGDRLYLPGLPADLELLDSVALPGGGISDRSIEVALLFTGENADGWAAITSSDQDIGDATGELSLIRDGDAYDRRHVLLSGPLDAVSYGAPSEPVSFSLTDSPWLPAGVVIPSDSQQCTADTWPRPGYAGYDDTLERNGLEEAWYPIVIGSPGHSGPLRDAGGYDYYEASPALIVEMPTAGSNAAAACTVLLAGHPTAAASASNSVRLFNRTATGGSWPINVSPVLLEDGLGQTCTVVQLDNSAGDPLIEDGAELWAAWRNTATGGYPSIREAGRSLRELGEVLAWLFSQSGLSIDTDALRALEPELAGLYVDTVINDQIDPVDLLLDQVLPLFPLVWWISPRGLVLKRWPYDAEGTDVQATIDTSTGCERVTAVSRSSPYDVTNRRGISYAWKPPVDHHLARITLAPSKRADEGTTELEPYLMASARRYGERQAEDLSTEIIMDGPTARAALSWLVRWDSSTREQVAYLCPLEYSSLEPCAVVQVTDPDLGWTERLCAVTSITRSASPTTTIKLVTLPDLIRDAA